MKRNLHLIGCLMMTLLFVNTLYAKHMACKQGDIPQIANPMKDWEIIAQNVAMIPAAENFKGNEIKYFVSAKPKNSHNKVSINAKTGQIRIDAEAKDQFDVTVKAKNSCGSVSGKFNVIIDEEA